MPVCVLLSDRKGVDLVEEEGLEELGGVEDGESIIRKYMRK